MALHRIFNSFTASLLCLTFTSQLEASPAVDHEQAQSAMNAVGQIYLREQLTYSLLLDCSGEFRHLAESADLARQAWQIPNTPIVEKSKRIQDTVANSIQQQQTEFGAVKFTLDIETLIHNSVTSFRSELSSKTRKQRHYVCNRLILSITAGEWDLSQKVPDAVAVISDFNLESKE